jgi:hypothetical protein
MQLGQGRDTDRCLESAAIPAPFRTDVSSSARLTRTDRPAKRESARGPR